MAYNFSSIEYRSLYGRLLSLHKDARAPHIGGSISVLPVVYVLFSGVFDENKDKLVYSKGHTVTALYCMLGLRGFLSESELSEFYSDGTRLGGHPSKNLTPFCPFATGSLGHGPSLAAGLALGKKFKAEAGHIFCICGDGEWQEGACWEALTFCVHHKLNNITFVIDCNGWQGFGSVRDVAGYDIEGLERRLAAFGVDVRHCIAYDFETLSKLLASSAADVPTVVLAKSIKGKDIPGYEDTLASHYVCMDESLYAATLERMGRKDEE